MKANELRLGSLIFWDIPEKENVVHTVVGIRNDRPQTTPISLGESIHDYKPIPLTEEWLLKFGFKKETSCNAGFERWFNDCVYIEKINHVYHHEFVSVGSVHILQNLYFALTGEELTIKETT